MYKYDQHDQTIVRERAAQFREQVQRRLSGELSEDAFKPLRLQNGLYMQLHAYMLRVAIPYGLLNSTQMRRLGHIARTYDRGYGHFSTRQNIQYNWPQLVDVPSILDELADVEMHAIQTSGNCIRNVTSDHLAGLASDEIEDPRPYSEIIRQWSTFHPEFAFLPRKFKIAVNGSRDKDRAAIRFHDIGVQIVENEAGERGFEIFVGGGMGRTPRVGVSIRSFLEKRHLLSYLEAILRVYNLHGRRDNKYKARVKILVEAKGTQGFAQLVEDEWAQIRNGSLELTQAEIDRVSSYFVAPPLKELDDQKSHLDGLRLSSDTNIRAFAKQNVVLHKKPGYAAVLISLKTKDLPPGDITADQMDFVADLADRYSFGEIVATHRQNLVLPHVEITQLQALHRELATFGLAEPNIGQISDIISCPGLDYCNLANARSIPTASKLQAHFDDIDYRHDLGDLTLNISGCINACGHHHVGNIGILGINKQGEEFYQITLGGSAGADASIGKILGPALSEDEVVQGVGRVVEAYLATRESAEESFLDCYRRVGDKPFKERVYA